MIEIKIDSRWTQRWSAIDPKASEEWSQQLVSAFYPEEAADALFDPRITAQGEDALRRLMGEHTGAKVANQIFDGLPSDFSARAQSLFEMYVSEILSVIPDPARGILRRIPIVLTPGIRDVGTGCRLSSDGTRAFICIDAGYFGFLTRATTLSI